MAEASDSGAEDVAGVKGEQVRGQDPDVPLQNPETFSVCT